MPRRYRRPQAGEADSIASIFVRHRKRFERHPGADAILRSRCGAAVHGCTRRQVHRAFIVDVLQGFVKVVFGMV